MIRRINSGSIYIAIASLLFCYKLQGFFFSDYKSIVDSWHSRICTHGCNYLRAVLEASWHVAICNFAEANLSVYSVSLVEWADWLISKPCSVSPSQLIFVISCWCVDMGDFELMKYHIHYFPWKNLNLMCFFGNFNKIQNVCPFHSES